MASSHGYDLLFCDICGTMLSLNSPKYAWCPRCQLKRDVKETAGKATSYTVTAEDIRRELNLEPFVQLDKTSIEEAGMQRAVVCENCSSCTTLTKLLVYCGVTKLLTLCNGLMMFNLVNEACPQCNHPQLEYYTKQLSSADEGQTVF